MTGTWHPDIVHRVFFAPNDWLKATVVRWAYPDLPCKVMATARAQGRAVAAA